VVGSRPAEPDEFGRNRIESWQFGHLEEKSFVGHPGFGLRRSRDRTPPFAEHLTPRSIGANHHVLCPYGKDEGWGTGTEFG
jgi:hypothetical protein